MTGQQNKLPGRKLLCIFLSAIRNKPLSRRKASSRSLAGFWLAWQPPNPDDLIAVVKLHGREENRKDPVY
jgi:hypothetical protein